MNDIWTRYSKFIADKAAAAMRERRITQKALAVRMGRTQQYVSHVLSGRENLTIETIALLGKALEIDLMKELLLPAPAVPNTHHVLADCQDEISYCSLKSSLPILHSASPIIRRFNSGERPFMLRCDDAKKYLCKAAPFGSSAANLARELIGSVFANIWGLSNLELAIVRVLPENLDGAELHNNYSVSCLAREWADDSFEIKDSQLSQIDFSEETLAAILKIALFDIWLSNEDRLNNNLNLLYSQTQNRIIAIDQAGIFNASFSPPLMELSLTDSVLYSNLFMEATHHSDIPSGMLAELNAYFADKLQKCKVAIPEIWSMIPEDWKIDKNKFDQLMDFIFATEWIEYCPCNLNFIISQSMK